MSAESDRSELSSLETQLQGLLERIVAVGDGYRDSADSLVVADLDVAERHVAAARRSVGRAMDTLAEHP